MNNEVKLGLWQKSAVVSSFIVIALAMDVVSIDSTSTGLISLKVNKVEMVYCLLWLVMLCSTIFSWSSASNAYTALKQSSLHIVSGLAMEKIIDSGISAYPRYTEKTGNMTYAAKPKSGFLTREASIIVGTKLDNSPMFGTYDISVFRILPELITAYLRAIFIEGRWVIFLPYLAVIAATYIALFKEWSGSPYVLIGKIYA